MSEIIRYEHHGHSVAVRADLQGTHRDHCLCFQCDKFKPQERDANCLIANDLFALCCEHHVVTPVFECPQFSQVNATTDA